MVKERSALEVALGLVALSEKAQDGVVMAEDGLVICAANEFYLDATEVALLERCGWEYDPQIKAWSIPVS